MLLNYLELELAALEDRVNHDVANYFGEIDYKKLMEASGNYDNTYLNTDAKVNCAYAVASLFAARAALNKQKIEETLFAMKHVTHFWSLIYSSEQQTIKASDKARKMADGLHKDNRAEKEYVINYYLKHKAEFKNNKTVAANEISGKHVKASVATVRDWLKGV
jgi:hypothetical protein